MLIPSGVMNKRQLAHETADRLKSFILDGMRSGRWQPGHRLPTERELAGDFDASRGVVRQVLAELEADGRVVRHVGRGTFAAEATAPAAAPWNGAGSDRSVNPEEVMETRLILEPALAGLAVARASELEIEEMQRLIRKGAGARDMAEFERWDRQLHQRIVEASKNTYLISVFAGIQRMRQTEAWGRLHRQGLTMKRLEVYQRQHAAIVEALVERDAGAAERATRAHLLSVRRNLLGY
jgi:DNA-binding FadR family transcriptional regulator